MAAPTRKAQRESHGSEVKAMYRSSVMNTSTSLCLRYCLQNGAHIPVPLDLLYFSDFQVYRCSPDQLSFIPFEENCFSSIFFFHCSSSYYMVLCARNC